MKKELKIALLVLFLCLAVGLLLKLDLFLRSDQEDIGVVDVPADNGSGDDNVPDTEQDDYFDDIFWTDLY